MPKLNATLVSHTHWDRAWYVTFQEYRVRLVRLIDKLLSLLEGDPSFHVFMLDGQMSVLDDYLEVRPSQAEKLQAFAKSGRIQVGPWFVLADEFLVSPESLIRNLQLGHKLGKQYGGVAKIGYVPDGFGHIAQLPQILQGFGIDNAFFWRGMGLDGDRLGTEFNWRAPDGSPVMTVLMPWGYHNVTNLGYGIHWGDTSQMQFNADLALKKIDRAILKLAKMTNTGTILLMNGIDHAEAEPLIPMIIGHANEMLDGVSITHGTLAEHLEKVRTAATMQGTDLPEFEGEFRWGRYSEILQGVYSTRIDLKQENHAHEVLLERYLEPIMALAWAVGTAVDAGAQDLIALAWRWLLLNHPHDDMYGSGIDEVHHEMAYRFSQARQIAEALIRDGFRLLAREVDFTAQTGTPILLFNPLGWDRSDMTEVVLDLEFDDAAADSFQIVDAASTVYPHQVLYDEQLFWMEVLKPNRKRRIKILVQPAVPACGIRTLFLQPGPGQSTVQSDLLVHDRGLENDYVQLVIEADGGLTITNKKTGRTFKGLNHFRDIDDAGDEYSSCPGPNASTITTEAALASIKVIEQGPVRAGFRIHWDLPIPVGLNARRTGRSSETVNLPITTEVYLAAHAKEVRIVTTIQNSAMDHKLSVVFPTGLQPMSAYVDESFLIAERDLQLPPSQGWVEDPTALMHQRAFIDLIDDGVGFAVMNRGLPSVEAHLDGTILLTLLRAVGWLSRDDLSNRRIAAGPLVPTPGAQCLGDYHYEYGIVIHDGGPEVVYPIAYEYTVPTYGRRADTHPGLELREMNITRDDPEMVTTIPWPRGGKITGNISFATSTNVNVVLSALYRSGNALIARFYNISRESQQTTLRFNLPFTRVERIRMDETVLETLNSNAHEFKLTIKGAEVVTVQITIAFPNGAD